MAVETINKLVRVKLTCEECGQVEEHDVKFSDEDSEHDYDTLQSAVTQQTDWEFQSDKGDGLTCPECSDSAWE